MLELGRDRSLHVGLGVDDVGPGKKGSGVVGLTRAVWPRVWPGAACHHVSRRVDGSGRRQEGPFLLLFIFFQEKILGYDRLET